MRKERLDEAKSREPRGDGSEIAYKSTTIYHGISTENGAG
jgi:hypothetical protein